MGGMAAASLLPRIESFDSWSVRISGSQATSAVLSGTRTEEEYWSLVKRQFILEDDLILMNAANLCPSPFSVMETVFDLTRNIDSDASMQNRSKFSDLKRKTRALLADYLGAGQEEIVITRNTSEGNNIVIGGLTLKPDDEIVIWDQNHPTNNLAWNVGSRRHGYKVIKVATPPHPHNSEDLLRPFLAALTRQTKVIAFSHVSNISGVALPVKILCEEAANRNIMTLVDGAQTFGAEALNLHDMGCDFFTGSAHKWFMGPKEAGILYVRKDRIGELWPLIVGIGWQDDKEDASPRFEALGQRDDATIAATGTTVEFHNAIGKERIESRIRMLATELKKRIQTEIPTTRFHTPMEPELSSGVVVFAPAGVDLNRASRRLYEEFRIGCAVMRGDFAGIRLSPQIYNTMEEVERAISAVASL